MPTTPPMNGGNPPMQAAAAPEAQAPQAGNANNVFAAAGEALANANNGAQ